MSISIFEIIAILLVVLLVYLIWLMRVLQKYPKKSDLGHSTFSFQRERLDNQLYDVSAKQSSSINTFNELNHLILSIPQENLVISQSVANYSFFKDLGFDFAKYKVEPNAIVCLMPFHKRFDKLYKKIKAASIKSGYTVKRSDDVFVSGDILKHTIELILQSQIVIAVLDGRNPNVFYELGIAHSLGKVVLLLSETSKFEEVPFDVKFNKVLLYNSLPDLSSKLSKTLDIISDVVRRKEAGNN